MSFAAACPCCGHLVQKSQRACRTCGQDLEAAPVNQSGVGAVLAAAAALALLTVIVGVVAWTVPAVNEAIGHVLKVLLERLRSR